MQFDPLLRAKFPKNFKIGNDQKHEHYNFRFFFFWFGQYSGQLLNGFYDISKGNDITKRQHFIESVIEM